MYFEKLFRRFPLPTWGVIYESIPRNLGLMARVRPGHWVVGIPAGPRSENHGTQLKGLRLSVPP